MKTVSQLTVPQLQALIESAVERKIVELFGDTDEGLTQARGTSAFAPFSHASSTRRTRHLHAKDEDGSMKYE